MEHYYLYTSIRKLSCLIHHILWEFYLMTHSYIDSISGMLRKIKSIWLSWNYREIHLFQFGKFHYLNFLTQLEFA